MSYTQFDISEPIIENDNYEFEKAVKIDVKVKNTGNVKGKEVVQLYIRDHFASMTRAIKELKGFELVELYPGEERIINFKLTKDDFSFYNSNLEYIAESGVFEIMIRSESRDGGE